MRLASAIGTGLRGILTGAALIGLVLVWLGCMMVAAYLWGILGLLVVVFIPPVAAVMPLYLAFGQGAPLLLIIEVGAWVCLWLGMCGRDSGDLA
jgi:hypothetical protein